MNRKQRRAHDSKPPKQEADPDVPLSRPPEQNGPKAKTLYEIAAKRQASLKSDSEAYVDLPSKQNVVNVAIGPGGEIQPLDGSTLPEQTPLEDDNPWLETILLTISLSVLHFTLEALTVHQYADELVWKKVFWHTMLQAFPVLLLLIHFMHGHLISIKMSQKAADAVNGLKQILFVVIANIAGCCLIHLTNDKGYMAVMKNAPSIGTLWVWSVLELSLAGALAGVAGPGAYAWYYGYGIW